MRKRQLKENIVDTRQQTVNSRWLQLLLTVVLQNSSLIDSLRHIQLHNKVVNGAVIKPTDNVVAVITTTAQLDFGLSHAALTTARAVAAGGKTEHAGLLVKCDRHHSRGQQQLHLVPGEVVVEDVVEITQQPKRREHQEKLGREEPLSKEDNKLEVAN